MEERIKRKNISNKVDDVLDDVEVEKMADEVSEEVIEGMNREVMKSLGEIYDINEDTIIHVIKGNFDEAGRFTGGLHSWDEVNKLFDEDKIEMYLDIMGQQKITNLGDIPINGNSVRNMYIKKWDKRRQVFTYEPKTLFPDEWDMEEIVKAGKELKENGVYIPGTKNTYEIQYKDVTIQGFRELPGKPKIDPISWFPKSTP